MENDPQFAEGLSAEIFAAGLETLLAATGVEGFKMALKVKPDLLIVDAGLPDIDGLTVLGQLQREGVLEGRPIIVLSDYNELDHLVASLAAGVSEFWLKSRTNPAQIAAQARNLLETSAKPVSS